jgi:hypothetical protein
MQISLFLVLVAASQQTNDGFFTECVPAADSITSLLLLILVWAVVNALDALSWQQLTTAC